MPMELRDLKGRRKRSAIRQFLKRDEPFSHPYVAAAPMEGDRKQTILSGDRPHLVLPKGAHGDWRVGGEGFFVTLTGAM